MRMKMSEMYSEEQKLVDLLSMTFLAVMQSNEKVFGKKQ